MQPPQFISSITQTYNVFVNPYGMRRLSPSFVPGEYDVLCARGKLAYDHEGNRRFRSLVKQHQKQYSAATCKYEKSKIVSFIVGAVRNASPDGGFVKNIDGSWFEVGDRHAKEKVGQTFRDLLHTKYSSSTKAKARARLQKRIKDQQQDDASESSTTKTDNADSKKSESTNKTNEKKTEKKEMSQPETVTSDHDQEMRSSVSVVSSDHNDDNKSEDATTVAKSNMQNKNQQQGPPPLESVAIFKTEPLGYGSLGLQHPGQIRYHLPQVSPSQTERFQSNPNNFLLGRRFDQQAAQLQQPVLFSSTHPGNLLLPPSIPTMNAPSAAAAASDLLEPLPIGASVNVLDFNESNSSIQTTEESFDDVMSEFCENMSSSVPV